METGIAELSGFNSTKNSEWFYATFKQVHTIKKDRARVQMFDSMLVSADEKAELETLLTKVKVVEIEAYLKGKTPV